MTRKLRPDDVFPILVTNENELNRINDLLHDLEMDMPPEINELYVDDPTAKQPLKQDIVLSAPKLSFTFTDQDMYIKKDWVSEFQLNIYGITGLRIEAKEDTIFSEANFNKLKYNSRHQELVFLLVEGQLRLKVGPLRLELQHIA
jgi:hypothetical protein